MEKLLYPDCGISLSALKKKKKELPGQEDVKGPSVHTAKKEANLKRLPTV